MPYGLERIVGEHDRLIANLILIGVIAELDEANARVRVSADGLLTDWLPWTELRAGPGMRTWSMPEIGEQVVILSPCGDPALGIVLGSIYQKKFPAPASAKTIHRMRYEDGTVVEYDRSTTILTVSVGMGGVVIHCGQATVQASETITLESREVRITGSARINGNLNVRGDAIAEGDVKAGSISLKTHHHTAQGSTSPTTTAQP